MILATDETVFQVDCDRCHRPDVIFDLSEHGALDRLRSEGWRVAGELVCPSCRAVEGLSVEQVASDYRSEAEGYPAPWDRSGL